MIEEIGKHHAIIVHRIALHCNRGTLRVKATKLITTTLVNKTKFFFLAQSGGLHTCSAPYARNRSLHCLICCEPRHAPIQNSEAFQTGDAEERQT